MSTDLYSATVLARAGAQLTLRYEPRQGLRVVSTSRTYWLAVVAEGLSRTGLESPLAEEIDLETLWEDPDTNSDEDRARGFVRAVSVRAEGADFAATHATLAHAGPIEVDVEMTDARWAEGMAPGLAWSGLTWDGALESGHAAALPEALVERAIEDAPSLWMDRAEAVERALAQKDPSSLTPAMGRAWILALWLRRPGCDRGMGLHVHGLLHLVHDVGASGMGPASIALRALATDAPQLAAAASALDGLVEVLSAAPDTERRGFFEAPMGTPSELARAAYRRCIERAGDAWSVHPYEDLVDRVLGVGAASVGEIVGRDVQPTYFTSMYLEQRITSAPGPWLREPGLAGRAPLHQLVSWAGHPETLGLVRAAVAGGADPNARDHTGMTPLLVMLDSAGPFRKTKDPKKYSLVDAARTFSALGADFGARRTDGRGAVALAVTREEHDAALLELLGERGASFDTLTVDGRTPLFDAGTPEAVVALRRGGASIEHRSLEGHTALGQAIGDGRAAVARALLEAGAAIDEPGRWGGTLLASAISAWDLALSLKRKTTDFPALVRALVASGLPLDVSASAGAQANRARIGAALAKVKLALPAGD